MKLRAARAKRRYKDKVCETPLVVTSYRDENGVARNRTIVSLAKLPADIIALVEEGLKRGDAGALDEYVPISAVACEGSVVVGLAFAWSRRDDEAERYARLDGCYVVRSNVAAERQTASELRDRYKDLKFVEQAFRTIKTTDIQTRPIRHFHEPQVRGRLFACFPAYRVIWELRQRLEPVLALCKVPSLETILSE